ncbi:DNA starvation/stationary phase protection protein [Fibrella sp. HMF5335]|uniref:DNA starvation/stationary phase protection protein n=1 Tax=Fibrella rubiginis TaxID=2817060 RepID=A0A939GK44_9BACT|nr:DNA starvation/stationary phase protection protein [Fibrella rubiginis]MBO0939298.1 DNA starvation/stationary phase protection protein [Fibrella rubiginis]
MENQQKTLAQQAPAQLGNYRNEKADKWVPFEADKAERKEMVTGLLQATVVELLELYHSTKQSHWNLRGPLYFPLHENLDEYATIQLEFTDRIAERALHIGAPIDGRTGVIAQTANLGEFPAGYLADHHVLELMTERIYKVATRVRQRIEQLSQVDETTSNLLQELSYALDKQVWQLRVHMQ